MLCQLKQRDDRLDISIIIFQIKKWHDGLDIIAVEEVAHVSSYPILGSMGFYTGLCVGVAKIRAATLLGDIVHIRQWN